MNRTMIKVKYAVAFLCLAIGLISGKVVQAQLSVDLDTVNQQCICVSKTDTNQKKCKIAKKYNSQYKKGKVWVSNLNVEYVKTSSGIGTKVMFGKVKKASGYQIRYGSKYNAKKNKITKSETVTVKKNSKIFSKVLHYVQVRPYRVIKGKRYYGKWSSVYSVGMTPKNPATREEGIS